MNEPRFDINKIISSVDPYSNYRPKQHSEKLRDFYYSTIVRINSLKFRGKNGKINKDRTKQIREEEFNRTSLPSEVECKFNDNGKLEMYYRGHLYKIQ
ncbi:hypothetical protein HYW75_04515 [Candidatus Pacearchaeota archaeon]|nr:hypothetical protein [Candidatus Pacearchaeota archaeon]